MKALLFSTSRDFVRIIPPALHQAGCDLRAVVTGAETEVCVPAGARVLRPGDVNAPEFLAKLKSFGADIFVVVSFGRIFSGDFLSLPHLAAVNIHFSLLPAYRGAAPIERAVFNGEKRTGITVFKICRELDAGDVVSAKGFDIAEAESAASLYSRLAAASADVIRESVRLLGEPGFKAVPQKGDVSFAPRIEKGEGRVDFRKDSAELIYRKVLAFSAKINVTANIRGRAVIIKEASIVRGAVSAEPGRLLFIEKNRGFAVGCAEGVIFLAALQPAGKKPMSGWEFVLGRRLSPGDDI